MSNPKSVIHNVNPPSHFLNNMTLVYIEAMPLNKVPLIQLNIDEMISANLFELISFDLNAK